MAEQDLVVRFIGDDRSLQQALNRSTASVKQFDRQQKAINARTAAVGQAARGASSQLGGGTAALFGSAQFVAAALTTAAITKSVTAASNLNEQITKSQQVFGASADEVRKWSETTAAAFGISQRAALEAAGTFGNLFRTVDLAPQQAAEMSRSLTELAADLASFNNANIDDVLLAIRSGLIGEAEPLRRYGVLLSESRVQQEALAETGKKNVKQLTDQEKALARYNIILKDTVPAQGDFQRTSEGLANQQRILKAQVEDLSASLGRVLIPTVTAMISGLNDAIGAAEDLGNALALLARTPGIEIPVEIVSNVAGSRGGDILRHIVLGQVSPLALGITIGKEIADGIRAGTEGALDTTFRPGPLSPAREAAEGRTAARRKEQQAADARAGQAVVDAITRQVAAQKDLNRQLSDSEKRAAHLRDLIRADPDNAKLQARLRSELEKQASLRAQIAASAASAASSASAAAAAAKAEAEAAAATRKERERAAAIARREARQSKQFLALGLTAEGETPTPGVGALRRRTNSLEEQIKGTVLDTAKTRTQLQRIARVLSGTFGKVGKDVRQAILQMLNDISDALSGRSSSGPDLNRGNLTKFRVVNTSNILAGLGLSEEETKELRRRLSRLGPGGTMPQTTTTGGAFGFATGGDGRSPRVGGGGNVVINGNVYVNANDADQFRRSLERRQMRNSGVRSGPNATRRKN